MTKSAYQYMAETWLKKDDAFEIKVTWQRLVDWRQEPAVTRVEHPTRLDRARRLGYKAKQGYLIARV
ncbi:MAG: 50S ribosomal protein L15e, partial [Candidatus Helarchaeota archaeon]|nr:50S ribosomal protein L15e [Candidatus Helarchaeota archaeon]